MIYIVFIYQTFVLFGLLFSNLCICGMALFFSRDVLAGWTKNFSGFLSVYLGLGLGGNIPDVLGFLEHFFANLKQREVLLLSRLSNHSVLRAFS